MAKFFIYLLESSICLSILYLGYIFLFRKETYFNFIRIYLLLSLFLALSIPLTKINFKDTSEILSAPIETIDNFKSYYEQLIYITEPTFDFNKAEYSSLSVSDRKSNIPGWIYRNKKAIHSTAKTLLFVYLAGVLFFSIRFLYLLSWLISLVRKNKVQHDKGFKLVELDKEMPSFSFLGFLFLNKNSLTKNEFNQIIIHEKTHIKQWHSIDLIIVNLVTLIQWFNPLVWHLQKAFKTTHEYIADQKVVEQGYELLDYQSLLLRQLVSIRSVELVNNFNLLSIKKRIAMMNKLNSGFLSKFKALIAIPFIVFAFVLLSDISTGVAQTNNINNKLDLSPDIPVISEAKPLNTDFIWFTISVREQQLMLNDQKVKIEKLPEIIKSQYGSSHDKDLRKGVLLDIDSESDMQTVYLIRQALRQNNILKILYKSSENQGNEVLGLAQKLPPADAEIVDEKALKKEGVEILHLIADNSSIDANKAKKNITDLITGSKKYVMVLKYNNQTSYKNYIELVNLVYETVYEQREDYSSINYNLNFTELNDQQKKSVKKKYPLVLTMVNTDYE